MYSLIFLNIRHSLTPSLQRAYTFSLPFIWSLSNSVIWITAEAGLCGLGDLGFDSRQVKEFCLLRIVQAGCGVHLTSYSVGTAVSFVGSRVTGREVKNSVAPSIGVWNEWSYAFMAMTGTNLPFRFSTLLLKFCTFKAQTGYILPLLSTKKSCGPHMCQLLTLRSDIGTCRTLRSVVTHRAYLIVTFLYTNPMYLCFAKVTLVGASCTEIFWTVCKI
jgi:hypothetical protein